VESDGVYQLTSQSPCTQLADEERTDSGCWQCPEKSPCKDTMVSRSDDLGLRSDSRTSWNATHILRARRPEDCRNLLQLRGHVSATSGHSLRPVCVPLVIQHVEYWRLQSQNAPSSIFHSPLSAACSVGGSTGNWRQLGCSVFQTASSSAGQLPWIRRFLDQAERRSAWVSTCDASRNADLTRSTASPVTIGGALHFP
jgi:hypothetical protein